MDASNSVFVLPTVNVPGAPSIHWLAVINLSDNNSLSFNCPSLLVCVCVCYCTICSILIKMPPIRAAQSHSLSTVSS